MARSVELRKNADTAVVSVADQFANLFLAVVQTVRAHLVQLGKALALDPEALVVGEMEVQNIHLHRRHTVEVSLDHVEWNEVASNIDEQAAPGKPGSVFDGDGGQSKSIRAWPHKLKECLKTMQDPERIRRRELSSRFRHCQLVRLILAEP